MFSPKTTEKTHSTLSAPHLVDKKHKVFLRISLFRDYVRK